MSNEKEQEVNRLNLKVNVLLERIAGLENEKAEMRVDLHVISLQNEELSKKIAELSGESNKKNTEAPASD